MKDSTKLDHDRRKFINIGAIGLAAVPLGNLLVIEVAQARGSTGVANPSMEVPLLPESDPQALALAYNSDAGLEDPGREKLCRNCQLYSGSNEAAWGPCAIFSARLHPTLNTNFVVRAKGWCKSWGARDS